MNTADVVALIKSVAREVVNERKMEVRLATIDLAYVAGRPQVTFDGESTLSGKQYPHLSSYTPAAGDRVQMIRSGSTWVIQGKVV